MKERIFHIALASNERFMPGAVMACVSLAVNSHKDSRLVFHIFTEDVKDATIVAMRESVKRVHEKAEVIEYVCDEELLRGLPYWAGSRMASVRIFFPYLLKDVDWCLYLDCDILYLTHIEEHFSHISDDAYAVVVADEGDDFCYSEVERIKNRCGVTIKREAYFNSGVMLFNFKKCRNDKIPEKLRDFMADNRDSALPDQTALNVLFNGRTVIAPAKFNRIITHLTKEKLAEMPVLHYVSGKPWIRNYGEVANRRYRFWHAYADKIIWGKSWQSEKHLIGARLAIAKRILYFLLVMPILGRIVSFCFNKFGLTKGTSQGWRKSQLGGDVCFQQILSNR